MTWARFCFSLDEVCHVHIPCSSPSPHGEENGLRDGQIHLSQSESMPLTVNILNAK